MDCSAYVVDFNIYFGEETGQEISAHGLGYDVVHRLMQDYENQGYHLCVNNFYTSMTLAKHLARGYSLLVPSWRTGKTSR